MSEWVSPIARCRRRVNAAARRWRKCSFLVLPRQRPLRLLRVSQARERSTMGRCCRYSACLGPRTRDMQRSSPIPHSQTSTGASLSAAGNPYHSTCTRSRQRPRQLVHQSVSSPGSPRHPETISLPRYIGFDILKEWLMGYGWRACSAAKLNTGMPACLRVNSPRQFSPRSTRRRGDRPKHAAQPLPTNELWEYLFRCG